MRLALSALLLLLGSCSAVKIIESVSDAPNICDPSDTGFPEGSARSAIACYAGNFLVKLLDELNGGARKTQQHVRIHLLPYLGGPHGLDALLTDNIHEGGCEVCYMSDYATAHQLRVLRLKLSDAQLDAYDSLKPCYHLLTSRLLAALPVDDRGLWLLPPDSSDSAFTQALKLLKDVLSDKDYDESSCWVGKGYPPL